MINLKIGENHKCQLPNSWDEITLKDYEKIYTLINQHKKKKMKMRKNHWIK